MPQLDDLDVIIRRKNATTVVAIVPQASLYATGATVEAAFEALEQKRNELKAEMAAAGEADDFDAPPASGRATASGGATRDLWTFAAKACVAAVLAAVALDYVGSSTQTRIEEVTEKVRRSLDTGALRGGTQFWARIEQDLERQADPRNDLPEARKEKLLADLRVVVARWRPFVTEASKLFAAEGPAKAQ
jgi:hypothetical protein